MIIKWKSFALLLGGIAFLLVFIANLSVNLFITSIIRGFIAFIFFFVLGSILHLILYYFINIHEMSNSKGQNLDIKSSEQDNLDFNQVYQTSQEDSFRPMQFKKIKDDKTNHIINGEK